MEGNPEMEEEFHKTGPSYAEVASRGRSESGRSNTEQFDRAISRDNPKFHSVPKSRWRRTTSSATDYSPVEPARGGLSVPNIDTTVYRSRSLIDLTKRVTDQPYIPGLNFKQTPEREILSRRNSRRRKKSGKGQNKGLR